MYDLTFHLSILVIGLFLIAIIGNWAASTGLARLVITFLFITSATFAFYSAPELLGRAKPISVQWKPPVSLNEVRVLSGYTIENRGIYLTLVWESEEPRLIVLPWDTETAEQLQEGQREALQEGTELLTQNPFRSPAHGERLFYPKPQPELELKPEPKKGIEL